MLIGYFEIHFIMINSLNIMLIGVFIGGITAGIILIVQGLYWLIKKKARNHYFRGYRIISKNEKPREYWMYVIFSIGFGITFIIISCFSILKILLKT